MFITEEDYRVVIGENALKVVSQASQEIRDNAELEACEEIAGYLRPKYDTEAVFSAEGENRNRLVVMYAGKIIPDLPLATDEDGTPTGDLLIFGSQKQLRHNW